MRAHQGMSATHGITARPVEHKAVNLSQLGTVASLQHSTAQYFLSCLLLLAAIAAAVAAVAAVVVAADAADSVVVFVADDDAAPWIPYALHVRSVMMHVT